MKKIIICFIFFLILYPVTSFAEQTCVYTDSDLEKYKTSSSDKAYKDKQEDSELQKGKSDYQNYQDMRSDSERKNQKASEDLRRYEAERRRNR